MNTLIAMLGLAFDLQTIASMIVWTLLFIAVFTGLFNKVINWIFDHTRKY